MISSMDDQDGDLLITRVLAGGDDGAANDLLRAFHAGYPVDRLRLLLRSEVDEAVRAGAWILSELGIDAAPLIDETAALLTHRLKYVRFFAIDAVLASASAKDGPVIASAVALIDDPEEAVRWKALGLLSRAPADQLRVAAPFVLEPEAGARLSWLLDADLRTEDVAARLDGDRLDRLFAVAAATRQRRGRHQLLLRAAGSADPEVSSFARDALDAEPR